jgi:hypothetical protein
MMMGTIISKLPEKNPSGSTLNWKNKEIFVFLYLIYFSRHVWACLDLSGLVWTCLDLSGLVWTCLDLSGLVWTCLDLSGLVLICPNLSKLVQTYLNNFQAAGKESVRVNIELKFDLV